MIAPRKPENENLRLKALHYYNILDTAAEKDFDDIVELASQLCETPVSLVSLIDADRQWFKARKGMAGKETKREVAFCAHAILQDDIMTVPDATADERFRDNPLVTGNPDIRFYAGMPLITAEGFKLGTLCVIDRKPKQLTDKQLFGLQILAKQVMKQLELRATVKELKRLNDANSKMLSIIGHDLRSPIQSLENVVSLAKADAVTPTEFTNIINTIGKSLGSANVLFNNLMQWASTQFDGGGPRWQQTDLKALLADEVAHYDYFAEKGNALVNNMHEAIKVWADPNMVRFLIRNLVHNAHKFTKNGIITLTAESKGLDAVVCVEDTGAGMSAAAISTLFSWEQRKSTLGTNGEKGSGLGLQVCKEVVDKMHGKIWVESEPGKGSRFYFSLPLSNVKPH